MPTKVTLDDNKEYLEYSIEELEAARMEIFLNESHRWRSEANAAKAERAMAEVVDRRPPKRTSPLTPNRYKNL